jgi:hypothetical protein
MPPGGKSAELDPNPKLLTKKKMFAYQISRISQIRNTLTRATVTCDELLYIMKNACN